MHSRQWELLVFASASESDWRRFRPCWLPNGVGLISRLGATSICTLITPLTPPTNSPGSPTAEEILGEVSNLVRHLESDQLLTWLSERRGTTLAGNEVWELPQLLRKLRLEKIHVMASSLSTSSDRRQVLTSVARLQLELPEGNTLTREQRSLLELLAGRPISDLDLPWIDALWVATTLVGLSVNEALSLIPECNGLLLGIIRYRCTREVRELGGALERMASPLAHVVGEALGLTEADPWCGSLLKKIRIDLVGELLASDNWALAGRLLRSLDIGPFILTGGEVSAQGALAYREQVESIDKRTLYMALAIRNGYLGDQEAAFFYWTEAFCWQEAAQAARPLVIEAILKDDTLRLRDILGRFTHHAGDLADLHTDGLLLLCVCTYLGEQSKRGRDNDLQQTIAFLNSPKILEWAHPVEQIRHLAALSIMATTIFNRHPTSALASLVPLWQHFAHVQK